MIPIQAILILSLAMALWMYIRWFRSTLLDRLLVFAVGGGVLVLIMSPELSTALANKFGVGRGVDLIFYLSHAGMALVLICLYAKLRSHKAQISELTRAMAIYHAKTLPDVEEGQDLELSKLISNPDDGHILRRCAATNENWCGRE